MLAQALASVLFVLGFFQHGATPASPPQSYRVAGTVVDSVSGAPLARATVVLQALGSSDPAGLVLTGDDGRFLFEHLAAGKYSLAARRKGYIEQAYKQHENFATTIITGEGLDTGNLRFALYARASISGQVFDERNDPVRNAQVILFRRGADGGKLATRFQIQVVTDDEGRYHFGHLSPGAYFVGAMAQPWYAQHMTRQRPQRLDPNSGSPIVGDAAPPDPALDVVYPTTFFTNATDLAGASPITLRPGDAQVADLTLHPIPALHVLVRTSPPEESTFSVQATLPLIDNVQQPVNMNISQEDPGVMEIAGLPPGQVTLDLITTKGNASTTRLQTLQLASDVEIDAAQAVPSAAVSGVVKLDDGSPLSQAAILQLQNAATGESLGIQSEPNGEFDFKGTPTPIAPGTYDLLIVQPSGSAVRKLSATGAKVSGHSVEIAAGQDVRLTVVVSTGSGVVTGVALKGGKPLDGVMIVLVPQEFERNSELVRRDQSDSDGSFNLYEVLPGTYTVIAIENGWEAEWSSPGVLQKYLAGGEKVLVSPNGKVEVKVNVQQ